mmetsp:Transcript_36452/g.48237  ORF Transcript_36452/g.48237 Transcript_36452/m.48237 type:complete len:129 (+) Transcript_36452:562-948(+)
MLNIFHPNFYTIPEELCIGLQCIQCHQGITSMKYSIGKSDNLLCKTCWKHFLRNDVPANQFILSVGMSSLNGSPILTCWFIEMFKSKQCLIYLFWSLSQKSNAISHQSTQEKMRHICGSFCLFLSYKL